MAIPTTPADKNWPKPPNFLGIVIATAVVILIVLALAVYFVHGRAQKLVPMKTNTTPSQTLVVSPPTLWTA